MNPSSTPPPDSPPDDDGQAPPIVEKVDEQQLKHFVTTIKSAEQQVGEHIIEALRHDHTVAVLTTVVVGSNGQQQVLSAALNPEMMDQVRDVLKRAQEQREHEEPCVGFHCLVKERKEQERQAAAEAADDGQS